MIQLGTIYLITNLANGKYYVGQTIYSLEARWAGHISDSRRSDSLFSRAIRKYGPAGFSVTVLTNAPQQDLDGLEMLWIAVLDSRNRSIGYNLKSGGSHGKHSEETKRKISAKKLGSPGRSGAANPMFGKPGFRKGKKFPEWAKFLSETRRGTNNPNFGVTQSREMVDKRMAWHRSPEGRAFHREIARRTNEKRWGSHTKSDRPDKARAVRV